MAQAQMNVHTASGTTTFNLNEITGITFSAGLVETGLVAYYPFNGNANDASGLGHNGTVFGATLTTDRFGNPNNAYDFDGINDYIEIPSTGNLANPFDALTLTAWVNVRSWYEATYGSGWACMMHHGTSSSSPFSFQIKGLAGTWSPDTYGIYIGNSSGSYFDNSTFQLEQWYFVAVVIDSWNMRFYVNGELTYICPYTIPIYSSQEPYFIGKDPPEATLEYHNGKLDDIRVYNRALNGSEVQELYNEGGWTAN